MATTQVHLVDPFDQLNTVGVANCYLGSLLNIAADIAYGFAHEDSNDAQRKVDLWHLLEVAKELRERTYRQFVDAEADLYRRGFPQMTAS